MDERYELYRNDPEKTLALIQAVSANPINALAVGRELHWFDGDAYREAAGELLVNAYRALNRRALAEIAELHVAHRDLRSIDVLQPAPQP